MSMDMDATPDQLTSMNELVIEVNAKLDNLLQMQEILITLLRKYEPLLIEAERRLSGPLTFGRKRQA